MSESPFKRDLLAGKVALVTGGGTGIGRVISRELAAHGADVAVAARHEGPLREAAAEIERLGRRALARPTDVADPDQVKELMESVLSAFGRVDILVNNAAANFIRPSESLTPIRWKKVVDIVLNGSFYCAIEAGRHMLRRGGGSIVNVIATYAWTGAPGLLPSVSAKAGVLAMTRSLGAEWAGRGVRVNAIAPGFIDTPGARERLWPQPEMSQRLLASIPAGRFGREEDVSNLVLYLCSPLGEYINGATLVADGGHCLGRGALDLLGGGPRPRRVPSEKA